MPRRGGTTTRERQAGNEDAQRLRQITDAMPALIAHFDASQHYTFVNAAYARQFRRDREATVGLRVADVLGEPNYARVRPHIERALAGHAVRFEAPISPPDGGADLSLAVHLIPDLRPDGSASGVSVLALDVSKQRADEESLRVQAERLHLAQVNSGVWDWDMRQEQMYWSDELRALAELPADAPPTCATWLSLVLPEDRAALAAELQRQFGGESSRLDAIYRIRHPARGVRWLHAIGHITRAADGSPLRATGTTIDITEQRRIEEGLRESEARFRSLADGLPLPVFVHDAEGRQEFVNTSFCEFFGVTRERMRDGEWRMLVHPDDEPAYTAKFLECVRARRPFHAETRVKDAKGRWRLIESWGRPRFSDSQEFLGFIGTCLDITDRREAERAVRDSEWRFRQLANATPQLVWTARADGKVDYYNDRVTDYTGIHPGIEGDWTWQPGLHPDDVGPTVRAWSHAVRTGELYQCEHRVRVKHGTFRWHLSRAVPVRDSAGNVVRWFGTATDIDAQKTAEAVSRASEERLRQAVAVAGLGIFDHDHRTGVIEWSDEMRRICDLPDHEFPGIVPFLARLLPEDRPWVEAAIRTSHDPAGDGDFLVEHRLVRRDGSMRWVIQRAQTFFEGDGGARTPVRTIGAIFDITERKAAEQALLEADRRKDEFLAILAHELRNPLNPIKNAVEVLRLRGPQQPEMVWGRSVIGRQVDNLSRLIEDLLDVSRISRGTLELRREPVELAAVLDEAVVASRPLMDARSQELIVRVPSEPVMLQADVVRLTQIFLNLLNNAAKYTPERGQIWLTAHREGDQAVVSVRDTGVGIGPEQLPQLFDMFYQVDRGVERSHGGLGIGLTLVHRLVQMHGGTVHAFSAGTHTGAEFVVRLPVSPGRTASGASRDGDADVSPAPRRILIVDDNEDSAETLAELLRIHGSDVRTASDGASALETADEWRPDVMLLDIGMPRMSGYEVCRRLRAQEWGQAMTVIAQTGWGSHEDRLRSAQAGFDLHLTKPVDPTKLLRLLAELPPTRP